MIPFWFLFKALPYQMRIIHADDTGRICVGGEASWARLSLKLVRFDLIWLEQGRDGRKLGARLSLGGGYSN